MTGRDHDRYRDLTAAYVLGVLDPDDRDDIEAHLRSCDRCRHDVVDLAPLPALLARVDPAEVSSADDAGASAEDVVVAVRSDIGRLQASRRRWRWAAGAAAAAVVLVAVVGVVASGGDQSPTRRSAAVPLEVVAASDGAAAEVVADERPWGTYVHVSVEELPERDAYAMWVVDGDGTWEPAGSWARTSDGAADLGGSTQHHLSEIDRVVITSVDRSDEFLVARS